MKTAGLNKFIISGGILLLLLATGLSAADRTPPYDGWTPPAPFEPFKPVPPPPAKQVVKEPGKKPSQTPPGESRTAAGNYRSREYVVREGDWIAKILREKGVLEGNNLPRLLEMIRKLNQSVKDFDLIKPGEKIVILVKVESGPETETPSPLQGKTERAAEPAAEEPSPPEKNRAPEKMHPAQRPPPLEMSHIKLGDTQSVATIQRLKSESYRIQQGDILSMVVMHRYDLTSRTFMTEYLGLFKKCNPSIENPDRIFPGQTVNLPLYPPQWYDVPVSTPAQPPIMRDLAGSGQVRLPDPKPVGEPQRAPPPPVAKTTESRRKTWFSKQKAVAGKPEIPEEPPAAKKAPETAAPPTIAAPAPEAPAKAPPPAAAGPQTAHRESSWEVHQTNTAVSRGLEAILPQMGEAWVHSGEHFIPMKSGGHINLKADTYPIVKGPGDMTLIVDLYNSLPPRMGRVIESSWGNYRIVHLSPADDLRSAFGKILKAFQYPKVFQKDEPLKLTGSIPVSITGDWIVIPPRDRSGTGPGFMVINLLDDGSRSVPRSVKTYLEGLGVRLVEYPSPETPEKPPVEKAPEMAVDAPSLVEMVLTLTGHPHGTKVKIPAFKSLNDDFKLTVTADFYLTAHGRERVIDLSGLDPEIVALLKDRGIAVLSVSTEKNPLALASKTLKFLGWQHKMGPHTLSTATDPEQNVQLTLAGVIFSTEGGDSIFMTPLNLPPEVALFLYEKGYRVVTLASFSPVAGTRAGRGG